jgi:hypothetical protein
MDRPRGALAVLDRLDGEVAAAGAAVAAGPEPATRCGRRASATTGRLEREAGAGEARVVELLADRLHDHVGGEHPGAPSLSRSAPRPRDRASPTIATGARWWWIATPLVCAQCCSAATPTSAPGRAR